MVEELKGINLFTGLAGKELDLLCEIVNKHVYQPDENIIVEGDKGDKLYIIKEGKVCVTHKVNSGESQSLAVLSSGDFFGEISFLDAQPHSASVKAMKETTVLTISRTDFDELVKMNPFEGYTILHRISSQICNLLRKMDEKFNDMIKFVWEFGAKS
jgi:CRP-like cAMP-binding protein